MDLLSRESLENCWDYIKRDGILLEEEIYNLVNDVENITIFEVPDKSNILPSEMIKIIFSYFGEGKLIDISGGLYKQSKKKYVIYPSPYEIYKSMLELHKMVYSPPEAIGIKLSAFNFMGDVKPINVALIFLTFYGIKSIGELIKKIDLSKIRCVCIGNQEPFNPIEQMLYNHIKYNSPGFVYFDDEIPYKETTKGYLECIEREFTTIHRYLEECAVSDSDSDHTE